MIIVGSGGGENGVVLADQEGGLSFPQTLEEHCAMAARTGADSRLRRSLRLSSRRLSG
jgi:hypothetical protein